ncbi:MAG: Lrp/AsnC family transcriptional regulator [Anaerolineales bacterium]|jgi:Lrp/AsnC family transcriptional regulator for asnA, asnC and gidA
MDKIDLELIAILQKDGRTPFTEIAKQLNISEGTVRNRLSRLQEQEVIQIIGMVDPYNLGFDAPAMIGISVEPPKLESAAEIIATFEEVSYLIMVSGEFDLLVEVMCQNREALAEFLNQKLRQVPGVTRTQTYLILRTFKMAYGASPNTSTSSGGVDG